MREYRATARWYSMIKSLICAYGVSVVACSCRCCCSPLRLIEDVGYLAAVLECCAVVTLISSNL